MNDFMLEELERNIVSIKKRIENAENEKKKPLSDYSEGICSGLIIAYQMTLVDLEFMLRTYKAVNVAKEEIDHVVNQ